MSALRYARTSWNGCERSEIPSREREPAPERFIGSCRIILPGFDMNWTLRQDMRDMRRFYVLDLDGELHMHAAPPEMMRKLALIVPHYSAPR